MKIAVQEVWLIQLCTIVSIFSQIETVSSVFRPLMYAAWIITLGYYVVGNIRQIVFPKIASLYTFSFVLFIVLCILASLIGQNHLDGNYLRIMTIPLLVTIVGGFFGCNASHEEIQKVLKTYLLCALLYAIWVNITYFASYSNWLKQTMYAFVQKNSAAQIWAVGTLIALLLLDYKNKIEKAFGYIAALYLVIICGISQCRTALLALTVVLCGYILLKSKHRFRWICILAAVCVALWNIPVTRKFIDQALFLTKYAGADLNTFSSGRLDRWEGALTTFASYPVFGSGKYYVDCSYICVLAEAGIIGFILIETIWVARAIRNFKNKNGCAKEFLFCATIFYVVESLLEGYPPFGPGVSSFMFWFLSAIYADSNTNNRVHSET